MLPLKNAIGERSDPLSEALLKEELTLKEFRRGTHRSCDPSSTWDKIKPVMRPVGITRVANITGLDYVGIPVVSVCRPNSRSVAISQGKGIDLNSAIVSGVMESIEIFHAERILRPLKYAAYSEMCEACEPTVDLNALLRVSERTLRPDTSLFWIAGQSVVDQKYVWVPLEIVHTNYTLPSLPGTGYFLASSNGLASGNSYCEAISHGISEIVERDCLELWNSADEELRNSRKIDLSTIDDRDSRYIIDRYLSFGLAVAVWEITSDIRIPAFCCWLSDGEGSHSVVPGIGSGCHPSPAVALLRALTEAAQMRLTLISGARDDLTRSDYKLGTSPDRGERFRDRIESGQGQRDFRQVADCSSDFLYQDLRWQIDRLRATGSKDVIVVDLTRPQTFAIPVVRVIVPGLAGEGGFQSRPRAALL
jgi:YcaO-like protein with predicted kinase domain